MARKILLADDSVTAQNMGRKILADAGYEVLTVNNGSAALKRIAESKPDLIILDVYMPGYSGLEVCQRLKDAPETMNIPVLLSVGKLEPFKPQEARRVRADSHIVKPFEASELLTAIARLEDGIVPQGNKASFCSHVPGAGETEGEAVSAKPPTSSLGRKSTPPPAPTTDEESETPVDTAAQNFRDFRKPDTKLEAKPVAAAPDLEQFSVAPAVHEATSPEYHAAAASPTEASTFAPIAETGMVPEMPRDITKEELDALSALAAKLDAPAHAETDAPSFTVEAVPVAEAAPPIEFPEPPVATHAIEAAEFQVMQPAPELEEHAEAAAQVSSSPTDFHEEAAALHTVNTAPLAQESAPIDRQDEPMFASARAEEIPQETTDASPVDAAEISAQSPVTEAPKKTKAKSRPRATEDESPATVVPQMESVEGPAPSDDELAAALSLLTPAPSQTETAVPQQTSPADDLPTGHRWVAEALTLTPEEAAMLLEAEMFRTFAAVPGDISDSTHAADRISASVENRLASHADQFEPATEEAPKAMAAAATAEGAPTTTTEDSDIANIVDRVLADLRPRIVEEIARKLGKK